jgi:hypothetical protein
MRRFTLLDTEQPIRRRQSRRRHQPHVVHHLARKRAVPDRADEAARLREDASVIEIGRLEVQVVRDRKQEHLYREDEVLREQVYVCV